MKKLISMFALAAGVALAADGGKLNDAERALLLDQLETTKTNFIASLNGLSQAQWKFKPAPEVWSVAEVAEHLVLAEDFLFNSAQGLSAVPADSSRAGSSVRCPKHGAGPGFDNAIGPVARREGQNSRGGDALRLGRPGRRSLGGAAH